MSHSWPTTPRLSPATSIESTDSLATPNCSDVSTFADDCAVNEGIGHDSLFKNASEVWEEFEDTGCDLLGTLVADAGVPSSPPSSLLSGIDLLGDATSLPLPEVVPPSRRSGARQMASLRHISSFDFPSPPIPIPGRRMTFGPVDPAGSTTCGIPPMVSLVSQPNFGESHECLPWPIRRSQPSTASESQRRSTLPASAAFQPDKRRRSTEFVTSRSTDTFQTRAAEHAADPPVTMAPSLPFATIPSFVPGDAGYDVQSPACHSIRQESSEEFTSFMDMSVNESALSGSRVYNFFSTFPGRFKSRCKRH